MLLPLLTPFDEYPEEEDGVAALPPLPPLLVVFEFNVLPNECNF